MGLAEYFGFDDHDTDLRTELVAGLTTFLAMSYIVLVNPVVMTQRTRAGEVVKPGIALANYSHDQTVQMLAVVTLLASGVAMLVMAFYANRPFALAPGLGLNAFFAFTVVGTLGVPWQTALAAVFTEGLLFIVLTAVGAREYVITLFPEPVKLAVGTGIGLYLAIIGLEAMGIVVGDAGTILALGNLAQNPVAVVSILGLFFTIALHARGVTGSIVLGIIATAATGGVLTFAGVVDPGVLIGDFVRTGGIATQRLPHAQYDITPLVGAFLAGFQDIDAFSFALIVFTFFFVDFFDTAGTLVGVGQAGGFLNTDGNLPDADEPLMADAIGTTFGAIIGTSTVTTYIESATGVEEGGRTGMVALVVAVLFFLSLLVVPLAAAIPQYASHIALVVVALLMLANVTAIDWDDITHSIPAGLTIIVMPFTYSIAYGIAAGIVSYPVVKVATGDADEVAIGQWLLAAAFIVYFYVRTSGVLAAAV
ncbi:NCS2 family permease [Halobacterium salinarum]|uniref:Putative MFS transporter, AGZA family, xanthine/uracil permease n=1 Tax=Halobacterium salinarum (strain ATCC 33171 / DSM 3754 / JCM 8978 / NBRC 102687 / NCIMB 764 / 91-R6) TaxID=2597657 RepID=A0A4D6GVI3_HALS9|nr:NCS2 family permease [Halobacterium salinarum]MDL0125236.1 NCS2 family permease [Halobacterium salinarum]MDL0137431.1 NCS2 family permease [Halobacterium salinarum]MDL0138991.1 NCS2 family permease [Halobacterium salinarum]MDL0145953.1 NCS2 family permease [Halobacterium salinarum]QCC45745.1 xanthine/uracil permease family transport protein [Halobacterium salinarum]